MSFTHGRVSDPKLARPAPPRRAAGPPRRRPAAPPARRAAGLAVLAGRRGCAARPGEDGISGWRIVTGHRPAGPIGFPVFWPSASRAIAVIEATAIARTAENKRTNRRNRPDIGALFSRFAGGGPVRIFGGARQRFEPAAAGRTCHARDRVRTRVRRARRRPA